MSNGSGPLPVSSRAGRPLPGTSTWAYRGTGAREPAGKGSPSLRAVTPRRGGRRRRAALLWWPRGSAAGRPRGRQWRPLGAAAGGSGRGGRGLGAEGAAETGTVQLQKGWGCAATCQEVVKALLLREKQQLKGFS